MTGRVYNMVLFNNDPIDPIAHGEITVIGNAEKTQGNHDLPGSVLCTGGELSPICPDACMRADVDGIC